MTILEESLKQARKPIHRLDRFLDAPKVRECQANCEEELQLIKSFIQALGADLKEARTKGDELAVQRLGRLRAEWDAQRKATEVLISAYQAQLYVLATPGQILTQDAWVRYFANRLSRGALDEARIKFEMLPRTLKRARTLWDVHPEYPQAVQKDYDDATRRWHPKAQACLDKLAAAEIVTLRADGSVIHMILPV